MKSHTTMRNKTTNTNEGISLNSVLHQVSRATSLLIPFLYVVLYVHSLLLTGSFDSIFCPFPCGISHRYVSLAAALGVECSSECLLFIPL